LIARLLELFRIDRLKELRDHGSGLSLSGKAACRGGRRDAKPERRQKLAGEDGRGENLSNIDGSSFAHRMQPEPGCEF
jgi:hypothetical protein